MTTTHDPQITIKIQVELDCDSLTTTGTKAAITERIQALGFTLPVAEGYAAHLFASENAMVQCSSPVFNRVRRGVKSSPVEYVLTRQP